MQQQLTFLEPIEAQLADPTGNQKMVDYGIQNEQSNFRLHVCYVASYVYIFPTKEVKKAVDSGVYGPKNVSLDGRLTTAKGCPIPVSGIGGIHAVAMPPTIAQKYAIHQDMTTSTKGFMAMQIALQMLKLGIVPIPVQVDVSDDNAIQIAGTDILVNSELRIQVKCDLRGGEKRYGGTGNLFLQTHECNPYKLY